jgi:hypothetical protein
MGILDRAEATQEKIMTLASGHIVLNHKKHRER